MFAPCTPGMVYTLFSSYVVLRSFLKDLFNDMFFCFVSLVEHDRACSARPLFFDFPPLANTQTSTRVANFSFVSLLFFSLSVWMGYLVSLLQIPRR